MAYMKEDLLINMYLDYLNNYLTVEKFSRDNNLTKNQAVAIINRGKYLNELKSAELIK